LKQTKENKPNTDERRMSLKIKFSTDGTEEKNTPQENTEI
jgi:hypothetical protein